MEEREINVQSYLELFTISNRRFIVGIFQEGITIYKQQIRSLNILYSLIETERIKRGATIGIIGGGVAGLTIASAALSSGINVVIFEEKSMLLNVQYGCDTRIVHPHIYDWPESKSLLPYSDLPVLNWHKGTASEICREIYTGYKKIKESTNAKISEFTSCEVGNVKENENNVDVEYSFNKHGDTATVDILIYAIGYGIETVVSPNIYTPSYWRNDEHAQLSLLKEPKKFFISGTGDGGVMDLFRIKIKGFTPELIIEDMKCTIPEYNDFTENLLSIKNEWLRANRKTTKNWLYTKFAELDKSGALNDFKSKIKKDKERTENQVTLHNSKADEFKSILDLNRMSLFNSLFLYCLYREDIFKFTNEKIKKYGSSNRLQFQHSNVKQYTHIIIRHGTNKVNVLKQIKLEDSIINNIQTRQIENRSVINKATRLWPKGWWSKLFNQTINPGASYQPAIEFFTPDTQAICSSFVSVLSKVLEFFLETNKTPNKNFRVTLHRIVEIQNEICFQQISEYYGKGQGGKIGRVFPINGGIVGYVARTGQSVIIERKSGEEFEAIYRLLDYHKIGARALTNEVSSILVIPIFGYGEDDQFSTNLVLYLDSSEHDFFDKKSDLLSLLIKSTQGFIDSINRLIEDRKISMSNLEFTPKPIAQEKLTQELQEGENNCFKDISDKLYWVDDKGKKIPHLAFNKFHSFNIIFDNEYDPFQ